VKKKFQDKYGPLYSKFRDSRLWFIAIIFARKLSIGILIAVLQSSANIQNVTVFAIMLLFVLLIIALKPFLSKRNYWVEVINTLAQTLANLSIFLYVEFSSPKYQLSSKVLTFSAVAIQLSGLSISLVLIIYDLCLGIRNTFRKCLGYDRRLSITPKQEEEKKVNNMQEIQNVSVELYPQTPTPTAPEVVVDSVAN